MELPGLVAGGRITAEEKRRMEEAASSREIRWKLTCREAVSNPPTASWYEAICSFTSDGVPTQMVPLPSRVSKLAWRRLSMWLS